MKRLVAIGIGGVVFGVGLGWSRMTDPEVVLDFLRFEDLGLLLVMGLGVAVTLPAFQWWRKPIWASEAQGFSASTARHRLMGAVLFGLGWGISGVCPGAALASIGTGNWPVGIAVASMFAGAWVQGVWADRTGGDPS